MPRKKYSARGEVTPDLKFDNRVVAKFINNLMTGGKKSTAEGIFYRALDLIQQRTNEPGLKVFKAAMDNVKPLVEVRSRRVGGATYQVPTEVRQNRKQALAIRWIIQYSQERKGKPMEERLAEEIIEASKNQGGAIKKKEDTHKMAEANKAFAHFRW
ncbi:MAG: 30S ribosomal protein S7 [bacterium]|jgi:small subunit ribosomal protein S7